MKSCLNQVVADTEAWKQQAAYLLDTDPNVFAFAKNDQLGFAFAYLLDGQPHEDVPDRPTSMVVTGPGARHAHGDRPDPVDLASSARGNGAA